VLVVCIILYYVTHGIRSGLFSELHSGLAIRNVVSVEEPFATSSDECAIYDVYKPEQIAVCQNEGDYGSLYDYPRHVLEFIKNNPPKGKSNVDKWFQRNIKNIQVVLNTPNARKQNTYASVCKRTGPDWLKHPVDIGYNNRGYGYLKSNLPKQTRTAWACYSEDSKNEHPDMAPYMTDIKNKHVANLNGGGRWESKFTIPDAVFKYPNNCTTPVIKAVNLEKGNSHTGLKPGMTFLRCKVVYDKNRKSLYIDMKADTKFVTFKNDLQNINMFVTNPDFHKKLYWIYPTPNMKDVPLETATAIWCSTNLKPVPYKFRFVACKKVDKVWVGSPSKNPYHVVNVIRKKDGTVDTRIDSFFKNVSNKILGNIPTTGLNIKNISTHRDNINTFINARKFNRDTVNPNPPIDVDIVSFTSTDGYIYFLIEEPKAKITQLVENRMTYLNDLVLKNINTTFYITTNAAYSKSIGKLENTQYLPIAVTTKKPGKALLNNVWGMSWVRTTQDKKKSEWKLDLSPSVIGTWNGIDTMTWNNGWVWKNTKVPVTNISTQYGKRSTAYSK